MALNSTFRKESQKLAVSEKFQSKSGNREEIGQITMWREGEEKDGEMP
jgi:hypothetical protein